MPVRRQVTLPSVDARGRTWNTRLRRPVLCPLSYVDKNSAEAGRFERPKPTGPTRVQAGLLNHPDRFQGRQGAPGTAEGGRVELPDRLAPAVRFRGGWAHHMPGPSMTGAAARLVAAPTRFELAVFAVTGRRGLHSPTGPCAHRDTGGSCSARRPRAVARYASRGSNPDDQVKSLARWPLRERRSVGATGLAPVCHSEAALQAAAFAARPHPQVAGGRGGPTALFVGISAPVAGLFGVTFSGPVLVPHAPCRLCGRRCRPPRRRVSPRLRCRHRAGRWSGGLSLLCRSPAVVSCSVVVSVVV